MTNKKKFLFLNSNLFYLSREIKKINDKLTNELSEELNIKFIELFFLLKISQILINDFNYESKDIFYNYFGENINYNQKNNSIQISVIDFINDKKIGNLVFKDFLLRLKLDLKTNIIFSDNENDLFEKYIINNIENTKLNNNEIKINKKNINVINIDVFSLDNIYKEQYSNSKLFFSLFFEKYFQREIFKNISLKLKIPQKISEKIENKINEQIVLSNKEPKKFYWENFQ